MNLVDSVKDAISPGLVEKASSLLGMTPDRTRGAIDAAVPTVLGAVAQKGSTPEGARQLTSVLNEADDSILDDPDAAFSSRGSSLTESGGRLMNSFLGGNTVSGLSDVLGRFTGMGGGSVTSLLGMVAPLVFGGLRRAQRTMNLDADGLAGFLQSQKSNISSAMPSGLSGLLSNVPGLSSLGGMATGAAGAATAAGRQAVGSFTSRFDRSDRTAAHRGHERRGVSPWAWIVPLLLVLVVGWLVINWLNRPSPPRAAPASGTRPAQTIPATQAPGGVQTELNRVVDSAVQTLSGVRDAATAQAAAPQLQELNNRLDDLQPSFANLPQAQRQSIGSTVSTAVSGRLQDAADRALTIPGVREVIGPSVDSLMQKLRGFSGS